MYVRTTYVSSNSLGATFSMTHSTLVQVDAGDLQLAAIKRMVAAGHLPTVPLPSTTPTPSIKKMAAGGYASVGRGTPGTAIKLGRRAQGTSLPSRGMSQLERIDEEGEGNTSRSQQGNRGDGVQIHRSGEIVKSAAAGAKSMVEQRKVKRRFTLPSAREGI